MTIDEVFSKLAKHQITGTMVHESFANYYDFLGLKEYKKCHEEHFKREISNILSLYLACACSFFFSLILKLNEGTFLIIPLLGLLLLSKFIIFFLGIFLFYKAKFICNNYFIWLIFELNSFC